MSTRKAFDFSRPTALGLAGRGFVCAYVFALVGLPIAALVHRAAVAGPGELVEALSDPVARDALSLSFGTAAITALVQGVLGTATAWVLVRARFPGRRVLSALVDLPLALPTLVAGVMLVVLFGPQAPLGRFLAAHDLPVVYARSGIVLALLFVTFPFVVRAVEPVLEELDPAEEEAAHMLGASRARTFTAVILPAIVGPALSGSIRAFARALAEFGSLVVVSGNLPGRTLTAPVYVFGAIESGETVRAVAVSLVVFAVAASVLLVARAIEHRVGGRHA